MKDMRIRIKLPPEYARINEIKQANYPYVPMMQAFIKAVIKIVEDQGGNFITTLGKIEHTLAGDVKLTFTKTDATKTIPVEFRETDKQVIDFYESTGIQQSQVTLMMVRLLMRLCEKYGDSIPEILYLLSTLDFTQPEEITPEPVKPRKVFKVRPRANLQDPSTVDDNASNTRVDTSSDTSTDNQDNDEIAKRMQKLRESAKDIDTPSKSSDDDAEETVQQNPLLGNFFNPDE